MTPRSQRKRHAGDRLLGSHVTPEELAIDCAFARFDRAMREAEARWVCESSAELAKVPPPDHWGKPHDPLHAAARATQKCSLPNLGAAEISLIVAARDFSSASSTRPTRC